MQLKNKLNDLFSHFKLEQYANCIVASTFVHGLVNMKADREYLSPSPTMIAHCNPPTHISTHQQLCLNRVDVRSLKIVLCSRRRRSPCELTVNGCEGMF